MSEEQLAFYEMVIKAEKTHDVDFKHISRELFIEVKHLKEIVENLTTMTVCGDRKQIKNTAQYKLELAEQKIDKAIEEIECEIERYDGSNEDFISASWVEMKTDDYIAKLKNILEILGDKE